MSDEQALRALGTGNRTFRIAAKLGVPTPKALRVMKRLEARRKVRRNERFTFANDIYWEPTDAR